MMNSIKVKEKFIKICQDVKDSKTEPEFNTKKIIANTYSDAIRDTCGLHMWAKIVQECDMTIGSDECPTCAGIPLFFTINE